MPKDFPRSRRIAEQIQRELSNIIRLELKDPRVGMITLTDVEVSQDHSHAKVFFTLLGDAEKVAETTAGLQHAAGFLRSQLAHSLKLRTIPRLNFEYDVSVERGVRLSRLIDEAVSAGADRSTDK
jgi:ribosome-binding factor A